MAAGLRIVEGDRPAHRIDQVRLAVDEIVPGRRARILEIRHVDAGAGIERVDHHLAVDRTGDLDPAVQQVPGQRRHAPIRLADGAGFGGEIGPGPGIELRLALGAGGEQALALRTELALEPGDELERLGSRARARSRDASWP